MVSPGKRRQVVPGHERSAVALMALVDLVLLQTQSGKKPHYQSRDRMQKKPTLLKLLLEYPVLDCII